jgi:hypothetical protein
MGSSFNNLGSGTFVAATAKPVLTSSSASSEVVDLALLQVLDDARHEQLQWGGGDEAAWAHSTDKNADSGDFELVDAALGDVWD